MEMSRVKLNPGNRRRGRSKGGRGFQRGALAWRDDAEVLRRVELVAELFNESIATIHQAVNLALEQRGKPTVSVATIKADRRRAREVLMDRIGTGMQAHMVSLEAVAQSAWRSIQRTPHGPSRAPLLAIVIRAVEDQARLDGSWSGLSEPLLTTPTIDPASFGPSPAELLEAGELSMQGYDDFLVLLHRTTSPQSETRPLGVVMEERQLRLPAAREEVIEVDLDADTTESPAKAEPGAGDPGRRGRPGAIRYPTSRRGEPDLQDLVDRNPLDGLGTIRSHEEGVDRAFP